MKTSRGDREDGKEIEVLGSLCGDLLYFPLGSREPWILFGVIPIAKHFATRHIRHGCALGDLDLHTHWITSFFEL